MEPQLHSLGNPSLLQIGDLLDFFIEKRYNKKMNANFVGKSVKYFTEVNCPNVCKYKFFLNPDQNVLCGQGLVLILQSLILI